MITYIIRKDYYRKPASTSIINSNWICPKMVFRQYCHHLII